MNPLIRVKKATPPFLVALACFGLSPVAQAQLPLPTPDGFYPGGNTAEGRGALKHVHVTTGTENTAIGLEALFNDMSGGFNTATGSGALHENTTGRSNTANGRNALFMNNGNSNTAVGRGALALNTTGSGHTAIGFQALYNNTSDVPDFPNTATGFQALYSNTSGAGNTANGWQALFNNTVGSENTAVGAEALYNNIGDVAGDRPDVGIQNSAFGSRALFKNEFGGQNTAIGVEALFNLEGLAIGEDGVNNSALGYRALSNNTHGTNNVAVGAFALGGATLATNQRTDPEENTAVGASALSSNTDGVANTAIGVRALASLKTGENNIALGQGAGSGLTIGSESDNIDIGHPGVAEDQFTIRIGFESGNSMRTFIAGIHGVTTQESPAMPVVIDSEGQLGTESSSVRFKKEIKPMEKSSEAVLALKPVTFQYESDKKGTPQFGLIAEEVAEVNPDLVVRDKEGKPYSVRYGAVNAMLLNEFLKEHRKVEELKATVAKQEETVAQQQKRMEAVIARLEEQAAQIQKVSAQLEVNKTAPQIVLNNQ